MENPLSSFTNLPKPVQAVSLAAGGASLGTIFMSFYSPNPAWKIAAVGLIALGLVMLLFKIVLMLKDKSKSSPFAAMLARGGGGGRAGLDPAAKARMDDLRKKFEEGVETFKGAGKDLYSLPWFLLVGPSGSGKTEALRHSNVGFPQGLQDCLQGTGGTLNMHWWFTNHAVVLDTAGRMFMEEAGEGQSTEWKEFLKLLKTARPNCPVNGLLLVISSESLLKDSADKIEKTAGAISRQLDTIQRTLEVRFPVTVIVTKCDKIVGFREFFEGINDPALQHQILGWSNPASLDEAFKPEGVEQHLSGVRDRLMKRRAGMLQNPVHSMDPNGRRTDEIDEMFELPDNLMRIAPRLRRYLELIFVASEWSRKPLFLRGIYFTSSMREGQALDVTLAAALGVEVESLPGGKQYDKEKAYFLRDVFLGKVFKERGLVTRAAHVGKHIARQRAWIMGGSLAAAIIVGIVTVISWLGYSRSLGPPKEFWGSVMPAFRAHVSADQGKPRPLALFELVPGQEFRYIGGEKPGTLEGLPDDVTTRSDLIAQTTANTGDISLGWAGAPAGWVLGETGKGYGRKQVKAHRAVLESTTLVPLLQRVREKVQAEQDWDDTAVKALAQLVRLHTLAEGASPTENPPPKPGQTARPEWRLVDVAALIEYALGRTAYQDMDRKELKKIDEAVARAYPEGWPTVDGEKIDQASEHLFSSSREYAWKVVQDAKKSLFAKLADMTPGGDSDLGKLALLCRELDDFDRIEQTYEGKLAWLAGEPNSPGEADARNTEAGHKLFTTDYLEKVKAIAEARERVTTASQKFKPEELSDPAKMLDGADKSMRKAITDRLAYLRAHLPVKEAADRPVPEQLAAFDAELDDKASTSLAAQALAGVSKQVDETRQKLAKVGYLLTMGRAERDDQRLYEARAIGHRWSGEALAAAQPIAEADGAASTFAAGLARVADEQKQRDDRLTRLGTWAGGNLKPEQTKLDRSVTVSKRASALAAGRARWALIDAALRDPCWTSERDVAQQAAIVADRLISEEKIRRSDRERPKVPFSEMDGKTSEYDKRYLPEAGGAMLKAWDDIESMLASEGAGTVPVVAREDLAKLPRRADGRKSAERYVAAYIDYWKGQALSASRPNARNWDEFSARIKEMAPSEITDPLTALWERCTKALKDLPPKLANKQELEDAIAEVDSAMKNIAGRDGREFVKNDVLTEWSRLSAESPAKARDAILRACREGKLAERYFSGFVRRGRPGHILYINELLLNGTRTLVEASGGDLDRAWGELTRAKGVPLAAGSAALPDLSPDQVASVRAAASIVGGAAGSSSGGGGGCSTGIEDRELKSLVSRLAGEGYLKDEASITWFGKLQKVLKVLEQPVKVSLSYQPTGGTAVAGASDARDEFSRVQLFVDGREIGQMFSINTGIPVSADNEKAMTISIPSVSAAELRLYKLDPKGNAAMMANPDARIALGGATPWGVLREFLTAPDVSKSADGKWSVVVRTTDGKFYLPLTLKFDDAAAIPARSEWPNEAEWLK